MHISLVLCSYIQLLTFQGYRSNCIWVIHSLLTGELIAHFNLDLVGSVHVVTAGSPSAHRIVP